MNALQYRMLARLALVVAIGVLSRNPLITLLALAASMPIVIDSRATVVRIAVDETKTPVAR